MTAPLWDVIGVFEAAVGDPDRTAGTPETARA